MPNNEHTADEVARWMLERLQETNSLEQEEIVYQIQEQFGSQFTYLNESGGTSIDRKVLNKFKKLTGDTVVWVQPDLMWRRREEHDEPGRIQY